MSIIQFNHHIETIHLADNEIVGVCSDVHGNLPNLLKVIEQYPTVEKWFCLGDLVDSLGDRFGYNSQTIEWYNANQDWFKLIIGNHDLYYNNGLQYNCFEQLPYAFELIYSDGIKYLAYHSRPDCPVTFTEDTITEREFVDVYDTDDTTGILIGHNHKRFSKDFPYTNCKLISVGNICADLNYIILSKNSYVQY